MTRNISATSRSIIDTLRTLFIWLISLGLGWEKFNWLQVLGIPFKSVILTNRICDSRLGHVRKLTIGLDAEERSSKMALLSFDILGGLKSCFLQ